MCVSAKRTHGLKAHDRLTASLVEAAPDSGIDICVRNESVAYERVVGVRRVVRMASGESKIQQPGASGRGESEGAETRERRPARRTVLPTGVA